MGFCLLLGMDQLLNFWQSYWASILIVLAVIVAAAITLIHSKKELLHEDNRPIFKKFRKRGYLLLSLIIISAVIAIIQNLQDENQNKCLLDKISKIDSVNGSLEMQNKEILDTLKSFGFGIRKETGKIRPLKDADLQLCPGIDAAEITPSKTDSFYVSFSLCNKGEIDAKKLKVQMIFIYKDQVSYIATKPKVIPLQEDETIYIDNPKQIIGSFGAKGWTLDQMVDNVLLYLKIEFVGKSELKTLRKVIACQNINGIKWINVVGDSYEVVKQLLITKGTW